MPFGIVSDKHESPGIGDCVDETDVLRNGGRGFA